MTVDVSDDQSDYPLERARDQLATRAEAFGSLFRCVTCGRPLSEEVGHNLVVFDPHFGHNCGETGTVLAGLAHHHCEAESIYEYRQQDLPRFIHHQHGFFGQREGDGPASVVISTLLFDVLWVQVDGSTDEPWLSQSLANGSTLIDHFDLLEGRVASAASGWARFDKAGGAVNIGGQKVFDFPFHSTMEQWRRDAEAEGAVVFVQTSLHPPMLDPADHGVVLESTALEQAMKEMVAREPAAAVTIPVRSDSEPGKGAGRNDSCPCLSGKKFKRCCA